MSEFEIRLQDLKFFAYHGVFEYERLHGNEYTVDLKVRYNASEENLLSDNLSDTISYLELFEIVKREMETPRNLIETVAASIAKRIKTSFPKCSHIECTVKKSSPPIPSFIGSASATYIIRDASK